MSKIYKAWQSKEEFTIIDLTGQDLKDWLKFVKQDVKLPIDISNIKGRRVHQIAFFSYGMLWFSTTDIEPVNNEIRQIVIRFAKVFDQTYTRFLDLQKAEAQAREAKIELALERVRARTMAMHESNELAETAKVLFEQFDLLGIYIDRMSIAIINEESIKAEVWLTDQSGNKLDDKFFMSLDERTCMSKIYKAWQSKEEFITIDLTGQDLKDWLKFVKQDVKLPVDISNIKGRRVHHAAFFSYGFLDFATTKPVNIEIRQIVIRFAKVFDQTYTRFLDLQKAEAQNRESQIQLALERVRARTMAMYKSEELADTATILFEQLNTLGELPDRIGICTINEKQKVFEQWVTNQDGIYLGHRLNVSIEEPTSMAKLYNAWKKKKDHLVIDLQGQELKNWMRFVREEIKIFIDDTNIKGRRIHNGVFFSNGMFLCTTHEPIKNEIIQLLIRFAKVFDLTYTRFLDLQKAEAQAREAQIETALERVRSRTMAMQQSKELAETASVLFQQLKELGAQPERFIIAILNDEERIFEFWSTEQGGNQISQEFKISIDEPLLISKAYKAWKEKKKSIVIELSGKELDQFINYLGEDVHLPVKLELLRKRRLHTMAFFAQGFLNITSHEPLPPEIIKLTERFAEVFNLTYRRFLDLQKAEAQAREAQIETALERVRSRSMGMQKSDELKEVIRVVYEKFHHLKINIDHAGFVIDYTPRGDWHFWIADEQDIPSKITHPYFESVWANQFNEAKEKGADFFATNLNFEEKNKFYNELLSYVPGLPEASKDFYLSCPGLAATTVLFENVSLYIENFSGIPYSDEENKILMRFGKVFQQTYTRFLDLQKAETQARESQIQLALERVRARTMAMQKSEELLDVITVISQQLLHIGFNFNNVSFGINSDSYDFDFWVAVPELDHPFSIHLPYLNSPVFNRLRSAQLNGQSFFVDSFNPTETKEWMHHLLAYNDIPEFTPKTIKFLLSRTGFIRSAVLLKNIFLFLINYDGFPYSDEENGIIVRFANAFEQAYIRFLDLHKAEVQARDAIKQASLDRIRGEIASMRTAEDLNLITPIIWRELKKLEVPFIRCGVFIVDETQEKVQVYLTTPDGKSLGVLNLPFGSNELTNNTVESWKNKQIYREHWNKEEFINWTKSMMEIGQVQNAETYQGSSTPPESLDLHFVPFLQGMLYVGDTSPLADENIELVKTLAEAFSIAYSRYEDFKNLEDAKNKIEITLSELKSAQAQLVHSEKMASLGELTAGIAHEIKNPLNFVNNFSEVSNELLDELESELKNNNMEEISEIVNELKQNLVRINQHGKRADSIVKGMLLHSRGTSGEKTLTDINDLLDQYVNLAYHGMRAQNKEFNIAIEKDYDKTLEKINIVPQDISRVFLNLINNACYAAFDKKKKEENNFFPTLKVSTKNLKDKVEIKIWDNGNGIPADLLDKIFQPFFTTKPTGEGTGLGLSLSYDIVVKQHSGEIKFESEEGKYTEFIITLPKI
ncbi:MAG: ATP-binding protein [Ignavibacteriota bacterium]